MTTILSMSPLSEPLSTAPAGEPRRMRQVGDHALAQLRLIRDTMERSSRFTSVPGRSGQAMGLVALLAAVASDPMQEPERWLATWLGAGLLAVLVGGVGLVRKARRGDVPLARGVGRRFVLGLAPSLAVGIVLTAALYRLGAISMLPALWLLTYGAAVMAGGAFSVRPVPVMGAAFLVCGVVAVLTPFGWTNWILGVAFGGLHLVFGEVIARHHGG